MTDIKTEMFAYFIQILILIIFALSLNDLLAALIVSFFSRPLAKMVINLFKRNSNKKEPL